MTILMIGLAMFLGVHSVRIVAGRWRQVQIARRGEASWKLGFSVLSAVGLGLIIWGYGVARHTPVVLWNPPTGMRHAAGLLTLLAFILLTAVYVRRNHFKARFHHPMVLGVIAWAVAHLLANGTLAALLLFGAFLTWAALAFIAERRRDRLTGATYAAGTVRGTFITILGGTVAWAVFAFWLHAALIGVLPFRPIAW
ncbi:MAG: protein NrnU [Marmoricola sp.]|nr:protein NrnU [Marmoricola sp.]